MAGSKMDAAQVVITTPRKRAPGAGRKPLEGGIVSVNITLTPAHRDQLKAMGGSAWVRKMLDAVRAVEKKIEKHLQANLMRIQ